MKNINPKKWCIRFILLFFILLITAAGATFYADPFFHYRYPRDDFFYIMNDERQQNDGILRHFDYNALILGTSMAQQFMVSEANELFYSEFVKVSMAGSTFKELAGELDRAFATRDVQIVIRDAFDSSASMATDKDSMPYGYDGPEYLLNDNPFDDLSYLLNIGVMIKYTIPMYAKRIMGKPGGMTPFETYGTWEVLDVRYGREAFNSIRLKNNINQIRLSDRERDLIQRNLEQNVLRFAKEHPETKFYLFIPPYSIVAWGGYYEDGNALKQIEMEKEGISKLLEYENIHVYSFGRELSIVTNLDNYCDAQHYGGWVNSYMLEAMADDDERYRITKENLEEYIEDISAIYLEYDYESLNTGD